MRKLWKKQLPAAVLALIMMISLVPLAGAADGWTGGLDTCPHQDTSTETTVPATCVTPGSKTIRCKACGAWKTEPISPTNNHSWGSWYKLDDSQHQRRCSNSSCSATQEAAHSFSVLKSDTNGHWYKCSECEAIQGVVAHTFEKRNYDSNSHWMECSVCNYKDSSSIGAHFDNNSDGKCDTCNAAVHVHAYATSWNYDASQHWHQCSCGAKKDAASHYDNNKDGLCDVCNYRVSNYFTVTFQSLSSSGNIAVSNQTVQNNGYPYNPSDPSKVTFGGVTYTFKGWTTSYTGSSWYLYTNQPLVTPSYQRINSNATFYAVYTTNDKSTISYTAAAGKETDFDARDFYNAYRNQYNGTLNYVTFNVAKSTYNSFEGAVYAGNSSLSHSDLTDSRFYYDEDDAGRNDYALDDLSLVADKNADDDSITLTFTAYGTWGQMSGTVRLAVGDATVDGKTIVYRVTPGKTVDFDRANFNTVFQASYPSESLEYVIFDRPDSDAFDHGTLYSEYGRSSYGTAFTRSDLDDATFYYSNSVSGRDNYALNDLTFAAKNTFQDTVKLSFTAYGANSSHRVYGTVELRSSENASDGDITYKVSPGKSVDFDRSDFLSFLRDTYRNADLDYVIFDRPASANDYAQGTLYSGYGTSSQTSFSRSDLDNAAFYYNSKDATGRNDYALDSLTFVASSSFKTPIELTFTAYDEDGYDVDGTLVIQTDGSTSNYVGSVRYSTTTGTNVQINANDIARYFKKSTGGTLNYVMFTGVPSTGALYYNYYSASKYGSTGRTQLTSSNSNAFYFNPTSTAQYALTELTYVPSGSNYCVTIPFTAYGTNGVNVSGSLLISVSRSAVSEIYGVTSRNTAVSFPASGFYSAVLNATGSSLYSIQLLSLPASNQGTVYVGSGTSTRANTTTQYTYASGSNSISQLRFVPASTYTGSVEIPYVALNSNGQALASGTFSLGVVNTRRTFSDVGSSSWCYKYVTELSDAGVIDGYSNGAFKPDSTISYGAALKLVMLAAGYPEQAPTNSNSVFSGYLAKAQADGLVTRGNVNLSAPITRLQVAQLAAGALKLSTANLSSVKPFTDTSDLYVQALNAAGIVEGYFSNGTSTFRPNNTLTRGQVSAIVWRMQNYQK